MNFFFQRKIYLEKLNSASSWGFVSENIIEIAQKLPFNSIKLNFVTNYPISEKWTKIK